MPRKTKPSIKDTWIKALQSPKTRDKILIGSFITVIILASLPVFFQFIERREGIVLNDWVLARIPAYNVSVPIFAIIWGMALLILYRALYNPLIYIRYSWTLIFVNIARMISITLTSLNPPKNMQNLIDPITGIFYGHATITKDLFFSGHTATLVLIFLCLEKRTDKIAGFFAILIVMVLLLVQHIHYTVDVLAAPIFVFIIYHLTGYVLKLHIPAKTA